MRVDLHTHTTASDGLLSPRALVEEAARLGVAILAITDHDTTDGIEEALEVGKELRVEVIPGVELNTDVQGAEIHVLGYYIDHRSEWFQGTLRRLRESRLDRATRMVAKLANLGIRLDLQRVLALAHGGSVGRPHLARAMVEAGYVSTPEEAFRLYLGRGGPAYVERERFTPEEAVQVILRAGGVPVLAHPGLSNRDGLVPDLVSAGLMGIEVYYPEHSPAQVQHYLALAKKLGLLTTGGTDFHGGDLAPRVQVGSVEVPLEVVTLLKEKVRLVRGS
ncbi:MAG: PHP domain-containing protein [Armatimonadota bacterium]|nr:PHP domain-containing protein [Armatimonadota bacterium]MDR5702440.1 PHP domain-containing protein [Armatimonadota bacterium]